MGKEVRSVSWTRKYRPVGVDTYVGNKVIKNKVKSMFKNDRLPQTLLFQGDRGCGKTTLARIVGMTLMCKTPRSDGMACGECKHCQVISEKFINTGQQPSGISLYEIDVTKMNSKEDATKIVEQMKVRGMGGRKKVYILDEVQRASPEAQNSYLKIMEEPPEGLYVILCTTNPEDLIDPLKSRFSMLAVKRPSVKEIVERLAHICVLEGVRYDEAGLKLIAKHAERIPRESISKLEMVSTSGDVTYNNVVQELQVVRTELFLDYLDIMGEDIFEAMSFIEGLSERGVDYGDFLRDLSNYVLDSFNMKLGIKLEAYTEEEYKQVRKVLAKYTTKEIARLLGLIREALKLKENPRYALTMMTLEMGYPEYLEKPAGEEVDSELKKEKRKSMENYREKKVEHQRAKEENYDKDEEENVDDILNMFSGAEIVDVGEDVLGKGDKK